jgi:hypothetical protein
MQPNPQLQRAIDRCYDAFAAYPEPLELDASTLRDPVQILKDLTSAPLHQISGEHIESYAGFAMTTVGDVEDYKHFLPRILELAMEGSFLGAEPLIIGERLKLGEWLKWPLPEQEAVRDLFVEAWKQGLYEHPDDEIAEDWLCGIANLDLDISAALEVWDETPAVNATLQLAEFCLTEAGYVFEEDAEERGYWSYPSEANVRLVRNWLLSDGVSRRLSAARSGVRSPDIWRIEKALEQLDGMRASRLH